MCPEVTYEANLGQKTSPTGRAEVGRCCAAGAGGSGIACSTFLLGLDGSVVIYSVSSFDD